MGCGSTQPGGGFGGHAHDHDEICLITGTPTTIQHAGVDGRAPVGSLYLFRAGERHGYRNTPREQPRLWIVHYRADPALYRDCPGLTARDAGRRIWHLDADRVSAYTSLFLRLAAEQDARRPGAAAASSAWLRVLLVTVARWQQGAAEGGHAESAPTSDPELLALWQAINDHVGDPAGLALAIRRAVPNYDSVRHRFRKAFKASPRALLMSLRMERAKHWLIEDDAPIADIARRLGYARQHEFARAFHREVGCTPTSWRAHGGNLVIRP